MNKQSKIMINTLLILILVLSFSSAALAEDKPNNTWVPDGGYAFAIDGSYSNTVYMYCDFEWSSSSKLSGLKNDDNETLEMDIVYYNYDGDAYSYEWYNYSGYNGYRGNYWETNQPRPYWDTQFDDSENERSFCLGCSDANQFTANSMYYWWGYGQKNSNGSMAKVIAQRGHRTPEWDYEDTYAVFAEESAIIVPFSNWDTPGSAQW